MRCRQSQRTDGSDLRVVVALEFGSQCKVCRFFCLLLLQLSLLVIADRSRSERGDIVWTDHAQILQRSHRRPRMAVLRMMRIIVLIADMVRVARATRSGSWSLIGSSPG
jgi:predicted nucleic acid-binding Zn ribbon protein